MKVLLAGATGLVGMEVLQLLHEAGHAVRTLSRDPERAKSVRPYAEDVRVLDATQEGALSGICDGIDVVISTLGAPVTPKAKERRSFKKVDTIANVALVAEAKAAKVRRFLYLGVYGGPIYEDTAYVQSHALVEKALVESGLSHTVVRPTGLFGAFAEFVTMARKGPVPVIGSGAAQTNPVHERDVAEVIMRSLDAAPQIVDVGGPDVLTRREIVELSFRTIERRPRPLAMPAWFMGLVAAILRLFHPRMCEFLRFVILASTNPCVAPKVGTRHLAPYLSQVAQREFSHGGASVTDSRERQAAKGGIGPRMS
jgi:uncharacterized protein YbjT (DUF2867 family)